MRGKNNRRGEMAGFIAYHEEKPLAKWKTR
jgi:hypothetical protein